MSGASSLDNVFGNSIGWKNYMRLSRLLVSGGTKVLRELFDCYFPPENLANTLRDPEIHGVLVYMRRRRIMTPYEWCLLFPPFGVVSSESWNISLLFKLLSNFHSLLSPPVTGWHSLPNSSDMSLPADLVRLKYYKNTIVYLDNELPDEEFNRQWEEIKNVLLRIVHVYAPGSVKAWEKAIDELLVAPLADGDELGDKNPTEDEVRVGEKGTVDETEVRAGTRTRAEAEVISLEAEADEANTAATTEITTPPEILARSPEALKAYKEALVRGKTKNRRVLVTVVGPARAGKTSLLKSLKGEEFDSDEDSTDGLVLQKAFCKPKENSWAEEDDGKDDFDNVIVECIAQKLDENNPKREADALNQTIATNFRAVAERHPSQKYLDDDEYEDREPMRNKSLQRPIFNEIRVLPREIRDLLVKHTRDTKNPNQKTNEISLKTLDFAGQQVYEVILPLFMSSKSIYILVYSLENKLLSVALPKAKHGKSERKLLNPFRMTHLDIQEFWLSSISSYTKNEANSVDSRIGVALPPVFVVCTHADVCEQDPREVVCQLCKILTRPENPCGNHVVPNVYTVNNTLSGKKEVKDESAKRLKRDIEDLSKVLPQVNEDIPVSWLRFEKELSKLVENEQKKYIDLEEARRIATKCNVDTSTESIELTTLLNYLHDLKTIIYFEETRTVFIDTQWLVNMFIKVITVLRDFDEQWKKYSDYWRELDNKGILHRDLVEHVWSDIASDGQNTVDSLLLIMEKFSLICPWRLDEEQVYLVPCMLNNSKRRENVEKVLGDQKSSTMVIRFKRIHLPMGIYPRLVVALAEHGKKEWPKVCLPKLRPNFCRMYNVGQEGKFDVCIISGIRTISVTVYNKNKIDDPSVTTFCQSTRKVLNQIFDAMQKTRPRVENMELEYGIRCPVCTKSKLRCSSHKTKGCKRDSCLHFVSEEELKKLDKPECHEDDTNPDAFIREEAYSHWFPKTSSLFQVQLETHDLETSNLGNEASGNACYQPLVDYVGIQDLATINPTEAAVKLARKLQLNKLSMADPPADIQEKCRTLCQYLKKMRRHDIIKEIRKTLPSGMTGPLPDDDTLYHELEFITRRNLSRALCGNDLWKCLASVLEVPGDQFGYFERQQNPAKAMLEDESNRGLKVTELYDLLVRCDAAALADTYL